MKPFTCTFTGADEHTPIESLTGLSMIYPFIEWGLLYSPKRQGQPGRYPSVEFLKKQLTELPPYVKLALHICGAGVPALLSGECVVSELVSLIEARGGRVQLNFNIQHGEVSLDQLDEFLGAHPNLHVITQHNLANADVWEALQSNANHALLFDGSGGRGILADSWPAPLGEILCGYAGGLGPENLAAQLPLIMSAASGRPFWIDMEGKLRDQDDRFNIHDAENCILQVDAFCAENLHHHID